MKKKSLIGLVVALVPQFAAWGFPMWSDVIQVIFRVLSVILNFYSLTRKQGWFEREIRDGLKSWHHSLRWAHRWRYGNAGCLEDLASHTL